MPNPPKEHSSLKTNTWQLDRDHSELGFRIKHLTLVATSGKIENFDVRITMKKGHPETANFQLEAEMASINTLHDIRDQRLKDPDFLDVKKYPVMKFSSNSLTPASSTEKFDLKGTLMLKGAAKPISLKAHYTGKAIDSYSGETKMGWRIEGLIDRRLWNIDFNLPFEGDGVAVGHAIKITAELEFKQVGPA